MAGPSENGVGALNKGGGYRSGPERWTGEGPPPARHIPWPEIFKHHISLIEGHQKMIDMVRKHTVEGTGNHRTICDILDRCKSMMYDAKSISRKFAPPPNQRDQVPAGSSSVSMYPGCSPADHVYGSAAMEAGKAAAAAKAQGVEWKPPADIDYQIGQGKGLKRKKPAEIRAAKRSQGGNASGSGSGTDTPAPAVNANSGEKKFASPKPAESKAAGAVAESTQPAFFVDTKPTPVNLPFATKKPSKRSSPDPDPAEGTRVKKIKEKHDGKTPPAPKSGQIEKEDISVEVDKRIKEKEERRKRKDEQKKEKKRKRETEDSSALAAEPSDAVDVEKPKKKKSKGDHIVKESEELSKKRPADDGDATIEEEGKKKKRKKHKVESGDS